MPPEISATICEEAQFWAINQQLERGRIEDEKQSSVMIQKKWSPLTKGWVKCNVG